MEALSCDGSPIIYLSCISCTSTSLFVFRFFYIRTSGGKLKCISRFKLSLVNTLVAVARLPGFDYYQCRLPTSDALPDLKELTFVSCICLGKLNLRLQSWIEKQQQKTHKNSPQTSMSVRTHWISSGRVGMRHLWHLPQKDMLLFYSLGFSGPMRERFWGEN